MSQHSTAIDGLSLDPTFLREPRLLFEQLLQTTVWDERMRARKTASFGLPYNYSGMIYPEAPFPAELRSLLARLEERLGYLPTNCLANYYPTGEATMGFHADSTEELEPGTGIAIVSLGAERAITFRSQTDRSRNVDFALASGSLLVMSAELQLDWKHAILADESADPRISLTFRRVRRR